MFLASLIRWLANHHNARIALSVGALLIVLAIALGAVGIAIHQPLLTRLAALLMIAGVAIFVIRIQQDRSDPRGRDERILR